MIILTRKQLDISGCEVPNCKHDHSVVFLHSVCHPAAGSRASYDKLTGLLALECRKCQAPIAYVKVGAE
jgi:hypothetical protein